MLDEKPCEMQLAPTIGGDYSQMTVKLPPPDGRSAILCSWDTAGLERFQSLGTSFFRGAKAIVAVYDLTSLESFTQMQAMLATALQESGTSADPHVIVIGNKLDLAAKQRQVSSDATLAFCRERNYSFLETSALAYQNVYEAKLALTRALLQPMRNVHAAEKDLPSTQARQTIDLHTSPAKSNCAC